MRTGDGLGVLAAEICHTEVVLCVLVKVVFQMEIGA